MPIKTSIKAEEKFGSIAEDSPEELRDMRAIFAEQLRQEFEAQKEEVDEEEVGTPEDDYDITSAQNAANAPPPTEKWLIRQRDLMGMFNEIFLESYDLEVAFDKSSTKYTDLLIERGISVNPQAVFSLIDMVLTRLQRVAVVKRLAFAMGLQDEYDQIIHRELDIIYSSKQVNKKIVIGEPKAQGEE